jgi:hypothetical protein
VTINLLSNKVIATVAAAIVVLGCAGRARSPAAASPGRDASPGTRVASRGADESARAVDLDGDGKAETWRLEVSGAGGVRRLAGTEHDGNGDGRVDRWVRFDPDGRPEEVAVDLDFDGRADVTRWYEGGLLARREEALRGLPRSWSEYDARGGVVRRARDLDGDGRPDAVERWTGDAVEPDPNRSPSPIVAPDRE